MKGKILKAIFSSSGASLAIGAAGFISAIVGMFISTDLQLSVKWLLLSIWLFSTVLLILLKLIYDLANEKLPPLPFEVPIRYVQPEQVLLIRRNENFTNQIIVGGYSNVDDIERLLFLGTVHHVQDKFIQIRVLQNSAQDPIAIDVNTNLKTLLIRPVVPLSAIQEHLQLMRS